MSAILGLQAAVFEALKDLGNVYDSVPNDAAFPYITIGDAQSIGDEADCIEGEEIFFDVFLWSREPGFPEVKALGAQVKGALNGLEPDVDGFNVHAIEFRDARYFRDGDGLTSRGVLTFRALADALEDIS